jgi:hypothetical protein
VICRPSSSLLDFVTCVSTANRLLASAKSPLLPQEKLQSSHSLRSRMGVCFISAIGRSLLSRAVTGLHLAIRPCDNTEAVVDVASASDGAERWRAAVPSTVHGWKASMVFGRYKFMSHWSSTLESPPIIRLSSAFRIETPSHQHCPSLEVVAQSTLHSANNQNRVTFAVALMLPLANYDWMSAQLSVPRMSAASSRIRPNAALTEKPTYVQEIQQLDRLLTLSCNHHGVKSIFGIIFYEHSILFHTSSPLFQGAATIFHSGSIQDLDIQTGIFPTRCRHLRSLSSS